MNSSVKWVFLFLALLVFASCSRGGGKIESDKTRAKSAVKTAVTGTVGVDRNPQKTSSNKTTSAKTTSKKKDMDFNGITQFHEP